MANIDFYYPFDSVSGDRKTTAATERRFFNALFTNGVVGTNAFNAQETSAGVYSIGAGVAIICGAIGGVVAAKSITAKPAQGASGYIALRLDTTSTKRVITLEYTASLRTDTMAQLENGGVYDLPLYKIEGLPGGGYGMLDEREYCTSFDAKRYEEEAAAEIGAVADSAEEQANAIIQQLSAALAAAKADNAGTYGAAGRQGFMNPCFNVNQRGAESYSVTSGATYTFDRWLARIGGAAASAAVNFLRMQDGQRTALKIENKTYTAGSTAAASAVSQAIERGVSQFCAGAKKFTVSFDAKASAAQRLAVEPVQFLQAGGAGTAIKAQTVSLTTNWQRFSLTFTGTVTPTAAQVDNMLKVAFFFAWRGQTDRFGADQNAANTVYLANMQINEGTQALSCYCPAYVADMEACKRYYTRFDSVTLAAGAKNPATGKVIAAPLPLTQGMRAVPIATPYDRAGTKGLATVEDSAAAWRNGLAVSMSTESNANPVFVVTDTVMSANVTRVSFSRVDLDAEYLD